MNCIPGQAPSKPPPIMFNIIWPSAHLYNKKIVIDPAKWGWVPVFDGWEARQASFCENNIYNNDGGAKHHSQAQSTRGDGKWDKSGEE